MMRPFSMVPAPSPRWMAWGLIGYRTVVLGLLIYIAYYTHTLDVNKAPPHCHDLKQPLKTKESGHASRIKLRIHPVLG